MSWNIAAECISIVFLSIILVYAYKGTLLPSWKNRMFQCCLGATFAAMVSNVLSTLMLASPHWVESWLCWGVTEIYFLATPLMGLAYYCYTAATIFEEHAGGRLALILGVLPGIFYAALVLLNPFTGALFSIRAGMYLRGPLIIATYLIFYFYCLISVLLVRRYRRWLQPQIYRILFVFPLIACSVIVVQQLFPHVVLSGSAATTAILLIYLYLQNKQISLDPLTGLGNRLEFQKLINLSMQRGRSLFSVMVISLRDFKQINDHFGQRTGDHFLKQIAATLKTMAAPYPVYRFSGDEFALLIHNRTPEEMEKLQQDILALFNKPFHVDGYEYRLHAVIGLAAYPDSAENLECLINGLEYAVNQAKLHHWPTCYCDPAMLEGMRRRTEIIEILKQKLQEAALVMVYQPIVAVKTGRISAVESLMRIPESPLGALSPAEFIPIAEETGLIIPMTWQILRQICAMIARLQDQGIPLPAVHVNFSAVQLVQPELAETVLQTLKECRTDPKQIIIEITETALAENPEETIRFARAMMEHGVKMEMDDFGTGYSNIDSVMHMPLSTVKLDRSLVVSAVENKRSATMLGYLIRVFHELGYEVLAEGVETSRQDQFVRAEGVDLIQGFYYSRPLTEAQLADFLTHFHDRQPAGA